MAIKAQLRGTESCLRKHLTLTCKLKKIDILRDACYPSQAVVQGRGSIVRHITNWCYPEENPQEWGRGEKKKTWL